MTTRVTVPTLVTALLLAGCADLTEGMTPPRQAAPAPGAVASLDRMSPSVCNPELARALAGARIPVENIRELTYGIERDEPRGKIIRYNAWVYPKNQPGVIVVQMDGDCNLQQIYPRDGATLPSQPS